jgi:hypothetical protein
MHASVNQILSFIPGPLTSVEREQLRRDRLMELRATIEAIRHEQTSHDPLLAWVLQGAEPGEAATSPRVT